MNSIFRSGKRCRASLCGITPRSRALDQQEKETRNANLSVKNQIGWMEDSWSFEVLSYTLYQKSRYPRTFLIRQMSFQRSRVRQEPKTVGNDGGPPEERPSEISTQGSEASLPFIGACSGGIGDANRGLYLSKTPSLHEWAPRLATFALWIPSLSLLLQCPPSISCCGTLMKVLILLSAFSDRLHTATSLPVHSTGPPALPLAPSAHHLAS